MLSDIVKNFEAFYEPFAMILVEGETYFAWGKQLAYFHVPSLLALYQKHGYQEQLSEFTFKQKKFNVLDITLEDNAHLLLILCPRDAEDIFSLLRFKKAIAGRKNWQYYVRQEIKKVQKDAFGKFTFPGWMQQAENMLIWDHTEVLHHQGNQEIFGTMTLHQVRKAVGLPLEKLTFLPTVLKIQSKWYISASIHTLACTDQNHYIRALNFSLLDKESLMILDALPFPAAITDKQFQILYVNRVWHDLFEKSPYNLQTLLQGSAQDTPTPLPANPQKWIRWSTKPYQNDRFLVLAFDESHAMFERSAQKVMLEKLEDSNKVLKRFAHICAHDLREPLRTIANYVQLLQFRPEKQAEYIQVVVTKCNYMRDLIEKTLNYSLCVYEREGFQWVNLKDLIKVALANLESKIIETDAMINWHLGNPVHLFCHKVQLIQVFQNIIHNALKFTKTKPYLHIQYSLHSDYHQISFSDRGIGIDPEYIETVGTLYTRLNPKDEFPGSGIGLGLCKKIVEYHKGQLIVQSNAPNEGITVLLRLPLADEKDHAVAC